MCTTPRADRSAEDRRLRKAEAVGSNPTRSTPSCENRGSVASSSTRNCRRLEGDSCIDARLDRVSRDHDALDTWNVFGRVLLEVAHVAGTNVEVDDRGLLVQINNRFPGLPSHGTARVAEARGTA